MSNEMQHTPGPYKQLRQPTEIMIVANGHHLASVPLGGPIDRPEDEANANLFTSAPDLLAALKVALIALEHSKPLMAHYKETQDRHSDAKIAARAAILKAEGK